jgi:nucleotide-binding universal stress UspA family protein
MLCALDASEPSPETLGAAAGEAARRAAGLTVVHCMDLLLPGVVGYEVPPLSPEVIAAMRTQWRQRLEGAVAGLQPAPALRLEEGPAGPVIVKLASELPAELVVVGTHGRTGLRHALLGSIAERVVRRAGCPVLTVHPEGWARSH